MEVKHMSAPRCRLHIVVSFQRVQYEKGEKKSNSAVEKSDKYYLGQAIKVSINNVKSFLIC